MPPSDPLNDLLAILDQNHGQNRDTVLVLGAGMNIHAHAGKDLGWADLIHSIALSERLSVPYPRPASMLAWWGLLIAGLARRRNCSADRAETELQEIVARRLIELEEETLASTPPFYGELLNAGYRDIISFNFDRRLALAGGGKKGSTNIKFDEPERHVNALGDFDTAKGTRIWYPHGRTDNPRTIKTGARQYGRYISAIEDARKHYKDRERKGPKETAQTWGDFRQHTREHPKSWFDFFMVSDLVFFGLSMGTDEWDLWWSLHQRARNYAKHHDKCPRTIFIQTTQDGPYGRPAGLDVVQFPSHDRAWAVLTKGLEGLAP